MSESGSRLHVSRAQAASLVDSQISTGDDLRRAIACATALTDLQALRPQLSAWSTRNEHVLVKVFGESERQAYRLAGPPMVALRSLDAQRAQMERRADSRLRYLQGAVTRIDLAEERWLTALLTSAELTGRPAAIVNQPHELLPSRRSRRESHGGEQFSPAHGLLPWWHL